MPTYRYNTLDAKGRPVSGEVSATDSEAALAKLAEMGLKTEGAHIEELSGKRPRSRRLSDDEAAELAAQVTNLAEAGLPLHEGLRALAEDGSKGKIRDVLLELAEQIESGTPIDQAIEAQGDVLPEGLRGLVIAGVRSGRLAEVLEQFAAGGRDRAELRRRLWGVFAYPIVLMMALAATFIFLDIAVVPSVLEFNADMFNPATGLDSLLPAKDGSLIANVAMLGRCLAEIMAFLMVAVFVMSRFRRRDPWIARAVLAIPLVGPLIRWNRLSYISRMVALLLKLDVALPEAFRMAADRADDAYLAKGCRQVADDVTAGRGLSDSMVSKRQFPPSAVALVSWGENAGSLSEAFTAASESLQGRAKAQCAFLEITVLPLVFLVVATAVCMWMVALYLGQFQRLFNTLLYYSPGDGYSDGVGQFVAILQNVPYLALFGAAVLAAMRLIDGNVEPGKDDPMRLTIRITGWVLLAVACLGIVIPAVAVLKVAAVFPCTVAAIVLAATYTGRREAQRKALLSLLATATRRFMPLAPVVAAFAKERKWWFALRARRLAQQLEEGVPLPDAMANGRKLFPRKSVALVRLGSETGLLAAALHRATSADDQSETAWRLLAGKGLCLLWLLGGAVSLLAFIAGDIMPQFVYIYDDYELNLPPLTVAFIDFFHTGGPFIMPFSFVFMTLSLYAVARYVGVIGWDLPGISRLVRRLDTAVILDAMSLAVEHGKPLPQVVESLARGYPKWHIRRRLAKVQKDLSSGAAWSDSLLARRLIGAADFAVLQAALKAGNMPWAMRALAESSRRRFDYRMNIVAQFAIPVIVLTSSVVVIFTTLAIFMPLIQMIEALTIV